MHISSCELCACAVNGFTALPFASDELVAIHREIDAKVNATAANPLTFARVFIVMVSFLAIGSVSFISQRIAQKKHFPAEVNAPALIKPTTLINETKETSKEEISSVTKTFKKIVDVVQFTKFERSITPIEQLELLKPDDVIESSVKILESDIIAPHYNTNVIYIYDLKVSDYNRLYFSQLKVDGTLFKTHTPVFRENKESLTEPAEEYHVVPADRVLKQGLASFNKQEFGKAIENFSLLLENNPDDVNARFYIALSYYNLNKTEKAITSLEKVLKSRNDAFYPEAQWYLGLLNLKAGNHGTAKTIFQSIVAEKGFYSRRAADKLKSL
jgi:tetratricopeptide (TPR) repeat protein